MITYQNLNNIKLTGKDNEKEYEMTLGFMNGFPRLNIWEKDNEDTKLFAAITFTPLNLISVLYRIIENIKEGGQVLMFDSLNHIYKDNKRTEELESRGKIIVFRNQTEPIIIQHKDKEIIFRLDDKEKYLQTNLTEDGWLKDRYLMFFTLLKLTIERNATTNLSEHKVDKK